MHCIASFTQKLAKCLGWALGKVITVSQSIRLQFLSQSEQVTQSIVEFFIQTKHGSWADGFSHWCSGLLQSAINAMILRHLW